MAPEVPEEDRRRRLAGARQQVVADQHQARPRGPKTEAYPARREPADAEEVVEGGDPGGERLSGEGGLAGPTLDAAGGRLQHPAAPARTDRAHRPLQGDRFVA